MTPVASGFDVPPEEWDAETAAVIARALERSGHYRVVQRLGRRTRYTDGVCGDSRTGVFLDVETTGVVPGTDRVIQLAMVPFEFDVSGQIYRVEECQSWLEDPGMPIPDEVVRLTGITDEMVRGQAIDEAAVHALLGRTQLIIAHNASFDRAFCERRLPAFADLHWGCSMADIPWDEAGYRGRSLEMLAYQHCRIFYDAHRADSDCFMGVHLLASQLPCGTPALRALLQTARQHWVRVWAISSPMVRKDVLKTRGYRWSPGDDGRPKAWHKDVPENLADAEMEWLGAEVYVNGGVEAARAYKIDRKLRHTDRVGLPGLSLPWIAA